MAFKASPGSRSGPCVSRLVIQPNGSLSWNQAVVFMALIGTVSLGIGATFAWLGFWVILPFAGLELTALAVALYISLRRNGYREVVSVFDDRVLIERGHVLATEREQHAFARAWARVRLEAGPTRLAPSRLWVGASGQFVELGRCLTDGERESLSQRLRECLTTG